MLRLGEEFQARVAMRPSEEPEEYENSERDCLKQMYEALEEAEEINRLKSEKNGQRIADTIISLAQSVRMSISDTQLYMPTEHPHLNDAVTLFEDALTILTDLQKNSPETTFDPRPLQGLRQHIQSLRQSPVMVARAA